MCTNCNDIEINTVTDGYNGWSPELGVSTDCTGKSVIRLISWIPGSGDKPSFNGNIMTDQYLIDNPIYLGVNGFTDACDEATDITGDDGAAGTTGPTGEQGNDGAPGTNGCNPNITITAQVSGEGEVRPYDVTVLPIGEGAPCNPEYSFIFPIEMITENAELTTAIDAAVALAMSPVTTVITPTIGTGIEWDLKCSGSGTFILDTNSTDGSFISYSQIGNKMTINFNIAIESDTPGSGVWLEMKIPNAKTSNANTLGTYKEINSIAFSSNLGYSPVADGNNSFIITTDSITSSSYLLIGSTKLQSGFSGNTVQQISCTGSSIYNFQGQITITTD
jgi:hypothetical protein